MISFDIKLEKSSSSSLSLSSSKEEKKGATQLSFAELLKGVGDKKDANVVQNGTLVLSLANDEKEIKSTKTASKNDALLALLKNESTKLDKSSPLAGSEKSAEALELNPKLTANLTTQEMKTLVSDAKEYLKSVIVQTDGYKKSQIKELPKTLRGLADVAKKVGVDISKITLEQVQTKNSIAIPQIKAEKVAENLHEVTVIKADDKKFNTEIKSTPQLKAIEVKAEKIAENLHEVAVIKADEKKLNTEIKSTPLFKAQVNGEHSTEQLKTEAPQKATEMKVEVPQIKAAEMKAEKISQNLNEVAVLKADDKKLDIEIKLTPLFKAQVNGEDSTVQLVQAKQLKTEAPQKATEMKVEVSPLKATEMKAEKIPQNLNEVAVVKADDKKLDTEIKSTPLFKAQVNAEHSTEQFVQTKQFKVEEKTPKARADETLKSLLMGEKPSQNNSIFTTDFSVATAKVIAPAATTDAAKALEKLLHGDMSESSLASKADGVTTFKADSFEVKVNEAKHMIKYLSADVKTAIEDYKSPFTRVKIQLNPQKLGDVDLTIVQRGKNLHVSLSSNTAAINTLSMNVNELKTQLSNSGINNATFNFNNSSSNSFGSSPGQQQHNQRQANEEYNSLRKFENEKENEEILSSLEIIVPRYI